MRVYVERLYVWKNGKKNIKIHGNLYNRQVYIGFTLEYNIDGRLVVVGETQPRIQGLWTGELTEAMENKAYVLGICSKDSVSK